MRDLEISRRLASGEVTPAEVDLLARVPLAARAAMFGHVLALVEGADPEMRAAALRALDGARGVPGVRALVRGLGDAEMMVRDAALGALRTTGRDAPYRYGHALFHPAVEIRRKALVEVPAAAQDLVPYLRADPACHDLARQVPWPTVDIALALELHTADRLDDAELLALITPLSPDHLRNVFGKHRGRTADAIDAWFADGARLAAPGTDPIDRWVVALERSGNTGRPFEHFIATFAHKKYRALTRRAAAALWSHARASGSVSIGAAAVVLEPRVLELGGCDRRFVPSIAMELVWNRWPVRPAKEIVERLLKLPLVRGDLALAAAVCGLLPAKRLVALVTTIGEPELLAALAKSDHGWAEICALPPETPAREIGWLAKLEASRERYVALAAITLRTFHGERLEAFVELLPRWRRAAVFVELAARLAPDADRLVTVCGVIAARIDRVGVTEILAVLLGPDHETGPAIALVLARALPDKLLGAAVRPLDDAAAERLVGALTGPNPLPRDRELAIAAAFAERIHAKVRAWALEARDVGDAPPVRLPPVATRRALSPVEIDQIATCSLADLEIAVGPAVLAPVTGLTAALAARSAGECVYACAALLACGDPLEDVARELDRFAGAGPEFDIELDNITTRLWNYRADLAPLGHARLFRWERHTDALAAWLESAGGPHAALALAMRLPGRLAMRTLWRGIAEVIVFARYRDQTWLVRHGTVALAVFAAERVDRDIGRHAARIVVSLVESGRVPAAAVKPIVLDRAADADIETRGVLARIARLEGMPEPPPLAADAVPERELIEEVRTCRDHDQLTSWCRDERPPIVHEAVMALVLAGEAGQARLAQLLDEVTRLAVPVPLLASVVFWEPPAREVARRLAGAQLPPEWQFHLCLGLGDHAGALAAVRAPSYGWFKRDNWQQLIAAIDLFECALAVADAVHHHAYQPAIPVLCNHDDPRAADALRRFLEVDADRPIQLRRTAARRLLDQYGDATGMPILIAEIVDEGSANYGQLLQRLSPRAAVHVAETVVAAALIGGHTACSEKRALAVVKHLAEFRTLDRETLGRLYTRILEEGTTAAARRTAAQLAVAFATSHDRLIRIAEVFAWGVRRGAELAGRLFRFHLTGQEHEFGHTRLDGNQIFVSALPMLRDEPYGRDVVEGLVLHEIGHHTYHRGEAAAALWKRAHDEGIGNLLNLIADEHLERNLRGVDRAYGDRLKRLGAYAFQHAPQELAWHDLLGALRGAAAGALTQTELEVGFDERSVRLRRGAVLTVLERAGHPLARFARALRMGLGNRHADPLVAQALELCGRNLKALDMQGLYDLTRRLADLFGGALSLATVFGGPEGLAFGDRDDDVYGAGIDDDVLQREVERILDPRRSSARSGTGKIERLQINVNPDDDFARITHVERVRGDGAAHRDVAITVARHAQRLRAHLDDLGLRYEPARGRIQGRTVDRTRLRALVTRNDPRLLIARDPVRRTDLFLGTVIDCSGSMQAGDNIDRARRFGILIAEAVRPLVGVEARFFGFTDSVIYDAGDAGDCGVTALAPGGGNNDAAALYHAATVALASRKRAKVLVMISDGLPTECSVAALRSLVVHLTRRRGIVCAQVAVRKLDEECFPHHIVLDDAQIDVSVARFGRMIGDLARRGLGA